MAAGDWSNACKIRPQSFTFLFDENNPPNILSILTQYIIKQPSGLTPLFQRQYNNTVPIASGMTEIQNALADLEQYEGLSIG